MKCKNNDIWVYVETKEDGQVKSVGLELLTPGRKLANKQNGQLIAILVGNDLEKAKREIKKYGVDGIIVAEGIEYKEYSTDIYVMVLSQLIQQYNPSGILIGATSNGRDMSPRIACRLKTGLTADCTSMELDRKTGNILWTRPTFGGNLMASIMCPERRPQMGTVRQGVYKKIERKYKECPVIKAEISGDIRNTRTHIYETIKDINGENIDLEGAEIIIAGGKGVGSTEGFQRLELLANHIGGVLGATRGAVESGWVSHAYQIGQTGKTVAPRIYIACGISGAVQHLVGMSNAKNIIAINKDRNAPIFDVADYGFVGDLHMILPELEKHLVKEIPSYIMKDNSNLKRNERISYDN